VGHPEHKKLYAARMWADCGLMPNMMDALPNIGGTLWETSLIPFFLPLRKAWLMPTARVLCSNAANIQRKQDVDAK